MRVSEKPPKFFHSARGSNSGPLGCESIALTATPQIVAQQNQVLEHLGANLRTPPHQATTTKPRDIPVLLLHQLQRLNATTHLQFFFCTS